MPNRILFLSQVLPYPLDAGPKTRAHHVLAWLAGMAETDLVTFVRPDDSPESLEHMRSICASVHTLSMPRGNLRDAAHLATALATGRSFLIQRDSARAMKRLIGRLVAERRHDAVHADQLWMAQYARGLPVGLKVLDNHNAVHRIVERLEIGERRPLHRRILSMESGRIGRYEASQVAAFDHTLYVSEADRAAVAAISTPQERELMTQRTSVLPICVDAAGMPPIQRRPDAHRVTVLGTMFWPPNVEGVRWMAHQVWPQVLSAADGIEPVLTVIGKRPPDEVTALAGSLGASLEVTGYVSDLTGLLEETAVFVVPLLSGGGMRVKILDAWAWGLPVVSTTVGAEGVQVRPGVDAMLADGPADFAARVVQILRDRPLADRLGSAGRESVLAQYDAANVYAPRLSRVYGDLIG